MTTGISIRNASGQLTGAPSTASISTAAAAIVVQAHGLIKRYGEVAVLRGVDLEVGRGEILALLGPNGAGKTTLVEILEGLREPTAGEVSVLGIEPATAGRSWRERVGIVLQESRPEPGLTVRESLALYAGYYAAPRAVDETIALVGLEECANMLGEELSGGQQRRLDVALGLIGDPEVLFLDEPTTGFDPSGRRAAWSAIDALRSLGKTIVLTTHHFDEAERLADRIAVIARGQIVAQGTPRSLGGRNALAATIRFTLPAGTRAAELPPPLRAFAESGTNGTVTVHSHTPLADIHELTRWALRRSLDLPDMCVHGPTLEDVYLNLIEAQEDRCC